MKNSLLPVLLCSVFFTACHITRERPISKTEADNNRTYKVEYLFEHDGCKVYRFRDNSNYVYFTSCNGETISYPDSSTVIRNTTNRKN
ncbi:MAG: DUF4884 domain-containing protein [Saprospiraceae bacterium]